MKHPLAIEFQPAASDPASKNVAQSSLKETCHCCPNVERQTGNSPLISKR